MSSEDEEIRITLRLSGGLRDRLASSAAHHSRSMNGEIIARLESSFDSNVDPKALADIYAAAEDMRDRVNRQWDDLQKYHRELQEAEENFRRDQNERRRSLRKAIMEERRQARERINADRHELEQEKIRHKERVLEAEKNYQKRDLELENLIHKFNAREEELGNIIKSFYASRTEKK